MQGRIRRRCVGRYPTAVRMGRGYPRPRRRREPERDSCVLMLNEHNPMEVIWQQREFIDHDRRKMSRNIDPAVRDDLANVVRLEYRRGSK